jgi:hypothetical protein
LSRVPPGYHVNPVADLVPVCPNCRSMIHRNPGPALTVDELKQQLTTTSLPKEHVPGAQNRSQIAVIPPIGAASVVRPARRCLL